MLTVVFRHTTRVVDQTPITIDPPHNRSSLAVIASRCGENFANSSRPDARLPKGDGRQHENGKGRSDLLWVSQHCAPDGLKSLSFAETSSVDQNDLRCNAGHGKPDREENEDRVRYGTGQRSVAGRQSKEDTAERQESQSAIWSLGRIAIYRKLERFGRSPWPPVAPAGPNSLTGASGSRKSDANCASVWPLWLLKAVFCVCFSTVRPNRTSKGWSREWSRRRGHSR